jgi:hypothetical protein
VKVNCAAIPPELIESELFGHDAARSRRDRAQAGLFEPADGGKFIFSTRGDSDRPGVGQVLAVVGVRASAANRR